MFTIKVCYLGKWMDGFYEGEPGGDLGSRIYKNYILNKKKTF
jgi:hypothetical protein